MNKGKTIKEKIQQNILLELNGKLELLNKQIDDAKESRNNDTKSSAGDKFETGREMAQIELNKLELQKNKTQKLQKELSRMPIQKTFDKVEFGSLVYSNTGNYFISFGIGKIIIEELEVFALSAGSPIGLALLNKKAGDKLQFQGREIVITSIS